MSTQQARQRNVVLLVEDDQTLGSVMAEILVGAGHTVAQTRRGADALRLAIQHQPSVVVLDLGLPDMAGAALLELLKAHPASRAIPVIVLSWQPLTPGDPLVAQADGVLPKPFDLEDFLAAVVQTTSREGLV